MLYTAKVGFPTMQEAQPSRTALRVALRRAAHQLVDAELLIFPDPFAVRILDPKTAEELKRTPAAERRPYSAAIRSWVVARARVAEDVLHEAVCKAGVTQYLILGAGLDTFALRNPYPQVRVFEVDYPATQAWKRERLASADLTLPATAHFVPVDFEMQTLREQLLGAGFDFSQPTVTAWLGVTMYLTREAFAATAHALGGLPSGSSVVFDYMQPREVLPPVEQLMIDSLAARVAQAGEPFQLFFTPEMLTTTPAGENLTVVEDWSRDDLHARFFAHRTDGLGLQGSGSRLCRAIVL